MREHIERLRALAEKQQQTEDRNFLLYLAIKLEDNEQRMNQSKRSSEFIKSLAERIAEHCGTVAWNIW